MSRFDWKLRDELMRTGRGWALAEAGRELPAHPPLSHADACVCWLHSGGEKALLAHPRILVLLDRGAHWVRQEGDKWHVSHWRWLVEVLPEAA